jgi:hypothetical protein
MKTRPLISFGLYAMAIKQDMTSACDDLQLFSKLLDLKTGGITSRPYITYEPSYWLLDGGYKFRPSEDIDIHVGLMSLSMSDENGDFTIPPVLTITFGSTHTTTGIILHFSQYTEDFANDVDISFYDENDDPIRTDNYYPITSWEFSTEQGVENFKKIIITFNSTNKPYRYLRLKIIDFGELMYFTNADIMSANIVEEINPLSVELPINTLELKLFSSDPTFSIVNPTGDYYDLQYKQPLDVYEIMGNETVYIGQFYLNTWENPSSTEILFKCVNKIGILDTVPCMGGIWLTPINIGDLIDNLMTNIGVPYELDTNLNDVEIKGWLPVCSYRQALQQIAFAAGAYITCSRSNVVRIVQMELASELSNYDYTILKAEKGVSQSLILKTLITGVEVTAHDYVLNSIETELYNSILDIGTYTITFNTPQHDLDLGGTAVASIEQSGANYAVINVTTEGTVVLLGQGYTETKLVEGVYNTELDPSVLGNILGIPDVTLVHSTIAKDTAQRVYDYYQQRYLQKVKLYAPRAEVGRSILIDTLFNKQIGGIMEKMTLDLTGGFVVNAEITGIVI